MKQTSESATAVEGEVSSGGLGWGGGGGGGRRKKRRRRRKSENNAGGGGGGGASGEGGVLFRDRSTQVTVLGASFELPRAGESGEKR